MSIPTPIAGTKLGIDPKQTLIEAATKAAIEAVEAALADRTAPSVVTTANYADLPSVPLHSADALSDAVGVWSSTGGFSGAVAVVDTANKTEGTGSVALNMSHPGNGATAVRMSFDLNTPAPVGAHPFVEFDVRWSLEVGIQTHSNYEVVIASGPQLTLVQASISLADALVPVSGTWYTVRVPVGAVTSIKSFGIRRKAGTTNGSSSRKVTWNMDRPNLGAATGLDAAIHSADPVHVVVEPGYASVFPQGLLQLGASKSLNDTRPAFSNQTRFRDVRSPLDWGIPGTGLTDQTVNLQALFNSLLPGEVLVFPPTAVYKICSQGETIDITKDDITIDAQGARFFEPGYTGAPMFRLLGRNQKIRGFRVFGRSGTSTSNASNMTLVAGTPTTSGTTKVLSAANDEVRIPIIAANNMTDRYSRDEKGFIEFDLDLSQATPVNGDLLVTVTNHDNTVIEHQQTLTVTPTRTTYPIRYMPDDLLARSRLTVKKVSGGNPIVIHSYKTYYRFSYQTNNAFGDPTLNAAFTVNGSDQDIEDCWTEGMGGDGLQIRGNDNHGLRVRRCFARGNGRENISVAQGIEVLIEDSVLAGSARDTVDVEPETDIAAISHLRFKNVVFGPSDVAFVCTGGSRSDHISLEDCLFLIDSGNVIDVDFVEGAEIRDCKYVWYGSGLAREIEVKGRGTVITNLNSDGTLLLGGADIKVRGATIRGLLYEEPSTNVVRYASLIVTGPRCDVQDITIGDPDGPPVVLDTSLVFRPVQLWTNALNPREDTTYGNIRCPIWKTEFGNTFKADVASQVHWQPKGQEMRGSGIRSIRGLSSSDVPANNFARSIGPLTPGITTLAIDFPPRTDVLQPSDFTLTPAGPEVLELNSEEQAGGPNIGSWNMIYDGQTTVPISHHPTAAEIQAAIDGLSNIVPGDVVVTGSTLYGGGPAGFTLTWSAAFGDLPETLFSTTSALISAKGKLKPVDIRTVTVGGFMALGTYWYRVAGRNFEGMPLNARAAKSVTLTSGKNAVAVSTPAPQYSVGADLHATGLTIWRTAVGGVAAGPYVVRYDLLSGDGFAFPNGGTDRGTNMSTRLPQTVNLMGTELDKNQSGWEIDDHFHFDVSKTWPLGGIGVVKRADGSGADLTFENAVPGSGSHFVTYGVRRYA